jgi:hypothetical protein
VTDKMTCPGCDSRTSGVLDAFDRYEPCPYCGLSYESSAELSEKRRTVGVLRANDEVKAIADAALLRAARAEAERNRLRRQLAGVRAALAEEEEE